MRKAGFKLLSVFALSTAMFFATSCSSDDEFGGSDDGQNVEINPNDLRGTFSGAGTDVVLDADQVYKLTGKLEILDNATLTIPAGTRIEGTGGTSSYIAIGQTTRLGVAICEEPFV